MTLIDSLSSEGRPRTTAGVRRTLIMMVFAVIVSGCSTPSRPSPPADARTLQTQSNGRQFDRVEDLVRTRYYVRDFNGVNWPELSARYRPLAAAATTDDEWYVTVNRMLCELRDAHTRARRPDAISGTLARVNRTEEPAPVDLACSQVLPDGIVYLRFGCFDQRTVRWLQREIAAHRDAPGMVLDLRDNVGGLVVCAQRAVGMFFPERVAMGWVVLRNGRRILERSRPSARTAYIGPLTVLVGPGSHSSAEVFAYVMQHYGRAPVIGHATAGQVLGARPYRLPDGGRLYVSVSDFHRFDGGRLEGEGVVPDVVSVAPPGRISALPDPSTDAALAAALAALSVQRAVPDDDSPTLARVESHPSEPAR